jgi:hypothetical protein
MDRGTKLMFGAMTIAICLMAFNMVGGKSQEANASMNAGSDYRSGVEPTIVWYGTVQEYTDFGYNVLATGQFVHDHAWTLVRAWSDGRVEGRTLRGRNASCGDYVCDSGWHVISDPNEGLAAISDLDDDGMVGTNDLLRIIKDWGPAPPNVIPPSDCPLAMINP